MVLSSNSSWKENVGLGCIPVCRLPGRLDPPPRRTPCRLLARWWCTQIESLYFSRKTPSTCKMWNWIHLQTGFFSCNTFFKGRILKVKMYRERERESYRTGFRPGELLHQSVTPSRAGIARTCHQPRSLSLYNFWCCALFVWVHHVFGFSLKHSFSKNKHFDVFNRIHFNILNDLRPDSNHSLG